MYPPFWAYFKKVFNGVESSQITLVYPFWQNTPFICCQANERRIHFVGHNGWYPLQSLRDELPSSLLRWEILSGN